jgi:phage anti-repressor protein
VKRDFSTWISRRIDDCDFIEHQDFTFSKTGDRENAGLFTKMGGKSKMGRPVLDYMLSLNAAKEIDLNEKNAK